MFLRGLISLFPKIALALPITKENLNLLECATKCDCSAETWNPVCGSDGVTYSNKCSLQCSKCFDKDLKLDHWGTCMAGSNIEGLSKNDLSKKATTHGRPDLESNIVPNGLKKEVTKQITSKSKISIPITHLLSQKYEDRNRRESSLSENLYQNLKSIIQINEDMKKETSQDEYFTNNEPGMSFPVDIQLPRNSFPIIGIEFQQKIIRTLFALRKVNEELENVRLLKRRVIHNLDVMASRLNDPTQEVFEKGPEVVAKNPSTFALIEANEDIQNNHNSRTEKSIATGNPLLEKTTISSKRENNFPLGAQANLSEESKITKKVGNNKESESINQTRNISKSNENDMEKVKYDSEQSDESLVENNDSKSISSEENEIKSKYDEIEKINENNNMSNNGVTLEIIDTSSQLDDSNVESVNPDVGEEVKLEPIKIIDTKELKTTHERNSNKIQDVLKENENERTDVRAINKNISNDISSSDVLKSQFDSREIQDLKKVILETSSESSSTPKSKIIFGTQFIKEDKGIPNEEQSDEQFKTKIIKNYNVLPSSKESQQDYPERVSSTQANISEKDNLIVSNEHTNTEGNGISSSLESTTTSDKQENVSSGDSSELITSKERNVFNSVSTTSSDQQENSSLEGSRVISKSKEKESISNTFETTNGSSSAEENSSIATEESTMKSEEESYKPTEEAKLVLAKTTTEPTSSSNTLPESTTQNQESAADHREEISTQSTSTTTTTTTISSIFTPWWG